MGKNGLRLMEGLLIICFALAGIIDAVSVYRLTKAARFIHKSAPGAAIYQGAICGLLLIFGLGCLVKGFRQAKLFSAWYLPVFFNWVGVRKRIAYLIQRKDAVTYMLLILYGFMMEFLGYAVASFVFFTSVLLLHRFGLLRSLATGCGMAGASYLLFVKLANMPFPRGLLW